MAADKEKREKLVNLLNEKAFDPVLRASPDAYNSDHEKDMLADVQRSTESEKKRFHDDYRTAEDVKNNYFGDLSSSVAKKKNTELDKLGLPKMEDVRDEFAGLCERLDV